jgi:hypothetical protein
MMAGSSEHSYKPSASGTTELVRHVGLCWVGVGYLRLG